MANNPQEQHESTVNAQQDVMRRALETHNGSRPTQGKMGNDTDRQHEIDAANGGLRK